MERPLRVVIAARPPMCFLCDLYLEFPIWGRCLTDTYDNTQYYFQIASFNGIVIRHIS
jgi:hypothetical protein